MKITLKVINKKDEEIKRIEVNPVDVIFLLVIIFFASALAKELIK